MGDNPKLELELALMRQSLERMDQTLQKVDDGLFGTDDRNPGLHLRTDRLEQSYHTTRKAGWAIGFGVVALALDAVAGFFGIK